MLNRKQQLTNDQFRMIQRRLLLRRLHTAAIVAVSALLGASCASGEDKAPLGQVCQFKTCTCVDANAYFWQRAETAPLRWLDNGDAACPSGFTLVQEE
jgi:hypothetical protein